MHAVKLCLFDNVPGVKWKNFANDSIAFHPPRLGFAERTRATTPPPTAALDEVPENLRLHSPFPPAAVVTMYLSCGRVQNFVMRRQTIEQ